MILDLSPGGKIPADHLELYNSTAFEVRTSFTRVIDSLSAHQHGNLDWFLSGPASRNIFASPLFHYCCGLAFLQKLCQQGIEPDEIVTDSPAMLRVCRSWLAARNLDIVVRLRGSAFARLVERGKAFFRPYGYLLRHLWFLLQARTTSSLSRPLPQSELLTLVDTFVMPGFVEEERYYPDMTDFLTKSEKKSIFFVPTFYRIGWRGIRGAMKVLRTGSRNILLKEDYLKLSDYLYAFGHVRRVRQLTINQAVFLGCNLDGLLREETSSNQHFGDIMIAFLNYRFARRLKEATVPLRLVIDWFENQGVDKGWNYGFNSNYPETPTVGYLGFATTPYYLSVRPTVHEKLNGLLPGSFVVIGRGMIGPLQEFCPELTVATGPAFRFAHLFQAQEKPVPSEIFRVLVALPSDPSEAVNILSMIDAAIQKLGKNVDCIVKKHPMISMAQLGVDPGSGDFRFSEKSFGELAGVCDLLISSMSSVCLETIAKGIPVVVMGNPNGVTLNPIPETIGSDIWRLCYRADELLAGIRFYQQRTPEDRDLHQQAGARIKDDFFTPVTRESVRSFLQLEP